MTSTYQHSQPGAPRWAATSMGGEVEPAASMGEEVGPAACSSFEGARYTMVPDALFDQLMAHLSGAELKVLLYIIRRTFGFKKESDSISLNQICRGITTREGQALDQGTGLSQSTVQIALKGLLEKQAIVAWRRGSPGRGYEATTYRLNLAHALPPGNEAQSPPLPIIGVGGFTDNRGSPTPIIGTALHRLSVRQHTDEQHTDEQHTDQDLDAKGLTPQAVLRDQPARRQASKRHDEKGGAATPADDHRPDDDRGDAPLVDLVTSLSAAFDDRAPSSTLTRVRNLRQRRSLPLAVLLARLREAAAITSKQRHITQGKRMAYLLTVLERLIAPSTAPRAGDGPPPRGQHAPPASSGASDVSRYTGGSYGVCPRCLSSPCDITCPTQPAGRRELEA